MTDTEVTGHLVQNADMAYLTGKYVWYHHDSIQDAYVHPDGRLAMILTESKDWESKPAFLTPANYNPSEGVSVKSDPINIHGLSLVDILHKIMVEKKLMEAKK